MERKGVSFKKKTKLLEVLTHQIFLSYPPICKGKKVLISRWS